MTGLLGFDADQHFGSIAALAIQRNVRLFLPYFKLFSPADRDQIFAAAKAANVLVGIIPIFETTAERSLDGPLAGSQDGQRIRQYMAAIGQPPGTAYILNAADFDEQAAQDQVVYGYCGNVVAENPGNPMIAYGNGALTEGLKAKGIARLAWDAGGMGMRGTRADVAAGNEDIQQDVGDVRGLHLGIEIDSDFAPHANSPADLFAWMDPSMANVGVPVTGTPPNPVHPPLPPQSVADTITIPPAVDLQRSLVAKGYDIGPTGADGKWGRMSAAGLMAYYTDLNQV